MREVWTVNDSRRAVCWIVNDAICWGKGGELWRTVDGSRRAVCWGRGGE